MNAVKIVSMQMTLLLTSSWSSPCLLVSKPDLTPQLCNDYRKVNSGTKPGSFPLPRVLIRQVQLVRFA